MHSASEPLNLARRLAAALADAGAQAVALVGSHARGGAGRNSDVDLAVVGDGPRYRLEAHGPFLVSIGWAPAGEQRRRLYDPALVATHVPGWRDSIALHDPHGVAAALREEATAWRWELVADECNRWVAEQLTGYAEEVQKLARSIETGDSTVAAVQRMVLALRLPQILAIHRRLLYGSENALWSLVAHELGGEWADAQAAALGIVGSDAGTAARAALRLFELAAGELAGLLDEREAAVVQLALRAANRVT